MMSIVATRIPSGTRIWIAAGVTDMRRGFDGLSSFVQNTLAENPFSGHIFVFRGRRGDLIKLLWWDGDAYVEGFATLQGALKRAARISQFEILGVISTRFKGNTDLSKTVLDSVKEGTSYRMYATIRESTKIGHEYVRALPHKQGG